MLLRSDMKKESCGSSERGSTPTGSGRKLDHLRREDAIARRNCEERVTYRTITRTEFQKRRASFESKEEVEYERSVEVVKGRNPKGGESGGLEKKARSMEELTRIDREEERDPYRIQVQEREMTDKLEVIHRMVKDMQEMTRQLKDQKPDIERFRSLAHPRNAPRTSSGGNPTPSRPLLLKSESELTVVPVRYKSTILIVIGSTWQRFKEEVELQIAPKTRPGPKQSQLNPKISTLTSNQI